VTVLSPPVTYNGSMRIKRLNLICAAVGLAAFVAGCGGTNPPKTGGSPGPAGGAKAAYKFSACMRQHGVANFPDPKVVSEAGHSSVGIAVSPATTGSPSFKSAQKACQGIMPAPPSAAQQASEGRAREQHMLAFARCVRSHGFSSFPDPTGQGQISPQLLTSAGINIHQPAFAQAAIACVPASGGALTVAQIHQALSTGP
jgi:hypothetical protein